MKTAVEICASIEELKGTVDEVDRKAWEDIYAAIMRLDRPTSLPPGKYWVGDLCYVMASKWDEVCMQTIDGESVIDGLFQLADGTKFGFLNTAWGDGVYRDQYGNSYSVDAGLIGCILVSDIAPQDMELFDSGTVFEFTEPFTLEAQMHDGRSPFGMKWSRPGILYIGHITIDTDPEDGYDDETEEN